VSARRGFASPGAPTEIPGGGGGLAYLYDNLRENWNPGSILDSSLVVVGCQGV
jgi:hypothetical protein